jgi:hypothetical protein
MRRASAAFDGEKKGKGEGCDAGGAMRRKEEGARVRSCHAEEDGVGEGGLAADDVRTAAPVASRQP